MVERGYRDWLQEQLDKAARQKAAEANAEQQRHKQRLEQENVRLARQKAAEAARPKGGRARPNATWRTFSPPAGAHASEGETPSLAQEAFRNMLTSINDADVAVTKASRRKAKAASLANAFVILNASPEIRTEIVPLFQTVANVNPDLALSAFYTLRRAQILDVPQLRVFLDLPAQGSIVAILKGFKQPHPA